MNNNLITLFIFSFLSLFYPSITKSSPSSSYQLSQKCNINTSIFIGMRYGEPTNEHYCISSNNQIIKIDSKSKRIVVLNKLNNVVSVGDISTSGSYETFLREYKIEELPSYRELVSYTCDTGDYSTCDGEVKRRVIAVSKPFPSNYEYDGPKKLEPGIPVIVKFGLGVKD